MKFEYFAFRTLTRNSRQIVQCWVKSKSLRIKVEMVSVETLTEQFMELGVEPSEEVIEKSEEMQFWARIATIHFGCLHSQVLRCARCTMLIQKLSWRSGCLSVSHISLELSRQSRTSTTSRTKNFATRTIRKPSRESLRLSNDQMCKFITKRAMTTKTICWEITAFA